MTCFSVSGSIDFVFVWVVEMNLVCVRAELHFVFSVGIEINSLCVGGGDERAFSVRGRKLLDFSVGDRK